MTLARLSVQRPVLATMVILAFVVLGYFSYQRLVVDLFPEVDFPVVTVTTPYPGAGPEEVESEVTEEIEDAVSTISGIKEIQSTSLEGLSQVIIEFELEEDVDLKAIEVKDEVEKIRNVLPDDVELPVIAKFDVSAIPIMNLAMAGPRPLEEIYELADQVVKEELSRVPGVGSVDIVGGREREIQVAVSRDRLKAFGLSITDVVSAVARENLNVPAGRITEQDREYTVRLLGEFTDLGPLRELRLGVQDRRVVRLGEVARILDGFKEQREWARFNREPGVGLTIQKRGDANTVETADGVFATLDELRERLPPGITISVAQDRSDFIRASIQEVLRNIFIGALLTAVLLFLFLHSWQGTVIAAVAMPTSIVASFILIDFAGFTVNVMTLLALGVSIGILVTNAIVVLESIVANLEQGKGPSAAAIEGTGEVAVAVVASTATNVVVFTPIAFMSGIVGRFFLQFGLTVVFATLFSLVVSFTLVPMLASKILRQGEAGGRVGHASRVFGQWWDARYARLEGAYARALDWVTDHRLLTVLGGGLLLVGSMVLFRFIGGAFIPQSDQGLITVTAQMPPGTPLERTDGALKELEEIVRAEVPEVRSVLATVGGGGGFGSGPRGVEDGQLLVRLVPLEERDRGLQEVINALRPALAGIPDAQIQTQVLGFGDEKDIVVEVTGPGLDQINQIADELVGAMQTIPGLVDIDTSYEPGKPEIAFYPDRHRLAEYGLTAGDVAGILRTSIEGAEASTFREAGEEYDIRVRLTEEDRARLDDVSLIAVKDLSGQDGQLIPLTQLGRLDLRTGPGEILRMDKERLVVVDANIGQGNLTEKVAQLGRAVERMEIPTGYQVQFGGQFEDRAEAFAQILQALLLAIILTYMVLASILESYIHPFTIMVTLPLGLVGASLALFLTARDIDLFAMMALVMLVGIVVNNAILILDYANILRNRGLPVREALLQSARTRLRPILMANLAIAIGMLPQTFGGAGSAFRVSMAVVSMGGVLVSAVFTLFLIPAVYLMFDRWTLRARRERGSYYAEQE